MQKVTATFTVTTPLFLGGANNVDTAELRLSSLKGCLRFWWRALAWSRLGEDLEKIRDEEARIFGSADTGQGSFLMRLVPGADPTVHGKETVPMGLGNYAGARYLGYGVMEAFPSRAKGTQAGELTRPCIASPFAFQVDLRFRKEPDASVVDALKALGLLGGMGSKARKGYGSLTLDTLVIDGKNVWSKPNSPQDYAAEVGRLLSGVSGGELPAYSAFSRQSRVVLLDSGPDPMALLDRLGSTMVRYRSWGRGGTLNQNVPSEMNFKDDHDWAKSAETRSQFRIKDYHPRRVAFGLPHNYGKSVGCEPGDKELNRRASPLLLHIHDLGAGKDRYVAIAVVLKSEFLPAGVGISCGGSSVPAHVDYGVVDGFIDGFFGKAGQKTSKPYFPNRKQVFPA